MPFDPHFDTKTKFLVLYLDAQMKASRMAKLLHTPLRTVQDWIKKTDENKDVRIIEQGRGPKSKLTSNLEHNILRRVRVAPHQSSTRELGDRYETSKSKVHDILKKRRYVYKTTEKAFELDDQQIQDRIEFCEEMLEENGEKIERIFFSDEMGIRLSDTVVNKAWGFLERRLKLKSLFMIVKLAVGEQSLYEALQVSTYTKKI